jgi:hypothetical protein
MNEHWVAIHEAGHATILASFGHATDIDYVTATPGYVNKGLLDLYAQIEKDSGITVPNFTGNSAGHTHRHLNAAPLPLEVEVPYCLAGAVAQLQDDPTYTFTTLRHGGLGGDIEHLVKAFKGAGYQSPFDDVPSEEILLEVSHLLCQQLGLVQPLPAKTLTHLRSKPRYACLEVGYTLATEKIRTHWTVVSELADLLVEKNAVYSDELLSLFERHGLSSA